jgi:hypothetical protein
MMGILPYTSESPLGLVMEMLTYAYSIDVVNETPKIPAVPSVHHLEDIAQRESALKIE